MKKKSSKMKIPKIPVAKGISIPKSKKIALGKKAGGSSTGKYKNVSPQEFAGRSGGTSPFSFPINTLDRARNALARAHFAPDPEGIRRSVYKKYPQLKRKKSEE